LAEVDTEVEVEVEAELEVEPVRDAGLVVADGLTIVLAAD
jgi:hypothetical protein